MEITNKLKSTKAFYIVCNEEDRNLKPYQGFLFIAS